MPERKEEPREPAAAPPGAQHGNSPAPRSMRSGTVHKSTLPPLVLLDRVPTPVPVPLLPSSLLLLPLPLLLPLFPPVQVRRCRVGTSSPGPAGRRSRSPGAAGREVSGEGGPRQRRCSQ